MVCKMRLWELIGRAKIAPLTSRQTGPGQRWPLVREWWQWIIGPCNIIVASHSCCGSCSHQALPVFHWNEGSLLKNHLNLLLKKEHYSFRVWWEDPTIKLLVCNQKSLKSVVSNHITKLDKRQKKTWDTQADTETELHNQPDCSGWHHRVISSPTSSQCFKEERVDLNPTSPSIVYSITNT